MSKDNQDQCFEVAAHEQQIREIAPQKTNLLGQANPIYTKKIEQSDIDYDGSIAFKILPPLQFNDINNYTSFKIANKNKEKESATKQEITIESGKQKEVKEQGRIKFFTSQQNHFLRYFQKDEIIYCKFNNSKHNIFKEVSYFAGVFLPRDVLRSKITNTYREQKIVSNIGELIQSKAKNRLKSSSQTNQAFLNKKNSIQFDSKFESGNLFSAFKTGKNQFHLVINNDINSKGSTQWFYFSVQGMEPNVQYTFNIVNFTKNDSLFNYGMKPVYYSVAQNNGISPHDQLHAESNNKGWYRFGKDVSYFKGQIQRQNSNKLYYTLSFKILNKFNNDKIYLAHSYPYTYTRAFSLMRNILNRNHKNEQEKKINKTKIFCNVQEIKIGRTIANRQLLAYLISPKKPVHPISKQCIIILARQHPGQTQGSFVCEGIIKLLTQPSPVKQVKFLLVNYQIYVVPMVNPDGVIFGNYRTNLSGKDLNRKWDSNDSNMSNILLVPEVVSIRDFLTNLTKNGNMSIRFILDLHGHSKKLNSFFYGNPNIQNPQLTKIYPYICSRFSEAVQFMDCTFSCQQYKKRAARVYLSSAFQQMHVYTFESSFYGYRNRQGKIIQFTPTQYAKLGQTLIKSLYLFLIREKQGENIQNSLSKISNENEQPSQIRQSIQTYLKLEKQLKEDQILIRVGDDESSGSESRPEQGQLNNEQIVYESEEEEEVDNRVIVSSKPSNKQANQKSKAQVSKTKSIRINSRKTAHQNTIEYKQMSKQYRNKKLITISQVNGVLADKYHISLLPIQRVAYRSGKKVDAQAQTQRNQKIAIRSFKQFQIEEKSGLTGYMDFNFQEIPEEESHCGINGPKGLSVNSRGIQQQKRHSQIVAQIQKNGRSLAQRSNYQTEKQLIGKRKLSQIVNISQAPSRNQRLKKRQIFTQTMATFKNLPVKQPTQMDYLNQSIKQKELQSESRIAQMEKINREVLRIYSKKSTIIDLGARPKGEKSMQKSYKQFKMDKLQVGSNKRY